MIHKHNKYLPIVLASIVQEAIRGKELMYRAKLRVGIILILTSGKESLAMPIMKKKFKFLLQRNLAQQ